MKNKIYLIIILVLYIFIIINMYNVPKEKKVFNIERLQPINLIKKYKEENKNLGNRIIIKSININKEILNGIEDNILNKNVVGLYEDFSSFEDKTGNIVLAGHNNKYVFGNLKYISLGDKVEVFINNKLYRFKVVDKFIVSKDDYSIFNIPENKKILTLITCKTINTRLIIVCE